MRVTALYISLFVSFFGFTQELQLLELSEGAKSSINFGGVELSTEGYKHRTTDEFSCDVRGSGQEVTVNGLMISNIDFTSALLEIYFTNCPETDHNEEGEGEAFFVSIAFLGVNGDYMYRFGPKKNFAWHIPFRLFTWFGATLVVQTGLGFKFIPYNSESLSVSMGLATTFTFYEGDPIIGVPFTMGIIKNLTDRLTFNLSLGGGPYYISGGDRFGPVLPEAHVGLGLKLGEYFETTNTRKIKVAKQL